MLQIALLGLVVSGNICGAAMAAPQAFKLRRTGQTAGVSPMWAGISAAQNAWWVAYATIEGAWAILPVAVISVLLYAMVCRYLVLSGGVKALGPIVAAGAASSVFPIVTVCLGGWAAVGVVLGALYGAQLAPAVIAAYRTTDASGIASNTWTMAGVEAALFGLYGIAISSPALLAFAACGLTASAAMLIRLWVLAPRRQLVLVGQTAH